MTETGQISDGFHTFDELYEHRAALFIALMRFRPHCAWYADEHEDGSMFEGFFIAGMMLPTGQITYHLKIDPWRRLLEGQMLAKVPHLERAPAWDGHIPAEVVERLTKWIETL